MLNKKNQQNRLAIFYVIIFLLLGSKLFSNDEYQTSKPASYDKGRSFQKFLSWTNEKTVTAQKILDIIGEKNILF